MIVVYHKNNRISKVVSAENKMISFDKSGTIASGLSQLAAAFPLSKIVWCDEVCQEYLNLKHIEFLFHHDKMMLSYSPCESPYFGGKIGYVEESPFIAINKKVSYPTWQMSSIVGVVHASLLLKIEGRIKSDNDFGYYLNSVAKVCMPLGLLCCSEPKLLTKTAVYDGQKASVFTIFKFVKQHYKTRWIVLLFLNLLVFEKRLPLFPLLYSLFFKSRTKKELNLDAIPVQSILTVAEQKTIDVIIPTIGRKSHLYDVLHDLAQQTHLPVHVIIVEQNPQPGSVSDLHFLKNETWPFNVKHTFTNQAGACNARNLALKQIESEWVFFADDDIRISKLFIEKTFQYVCKLGVKSVSISCLQKGEKQALKNIFQWGGFGSGCSFVFAEILSNCNFNMGYEFGFGEDSDFGMQLRNQGSDVLFLPEPSILHLKAPVGGFRTKPILKWHDERIQPKPSPTVMLYLITHKTRQQILGYKTVLFFKYFKHQKSRNPFQYFVVFNMQWNQSVYWANQLKIDS